MAKSKPQSKAKPGPQVRVRIMRAILADGKVFRPASGKPLEATISEAEARAHGPKSVEILEPANAEPAAAEGPEGPEKPAAN